MFPKRRRSREKLRDQIREDEEQGIRVARRADPSLDDPMVVVGEEMSATTIFQDELRDEVRAIKLFGRYKAQEKMSFVKS